MAFAKKRFQSKIDLASKYSDAHGNMVGFGSTLNPYAELVRTTPETSFPQ